MAALPHFNAAAVLGTLPHFRGLGEVFYVLSGHSFSWELFSSYSSE